jgi:L-seryl-tRNA(Ser) seleniumtransferase
MTNPYRDLPSVDALLADERLARAASELGLSTVTDAVREELATQRQAIASGNPARGAEPIAEAAAARAYASLRSGLRPVINATGVIIHTNLGRAPLSDAASAAMEAVARGYSNLEFDLDRGERGSRQEHVETLICRVTGAEAAIAVNNNAAALMMVLSTFAQSRQVVISRGQLVEIGGGFRIPDVMTQSGATLVEVGTTNRTYLRDYEAAIGENTAALMRVHTSNFRVIGFTESAALTDMVRLAHEHGILLIDDLGSGCLLDTRVYGLAPEPTPQESTDAGADLVLFSGDKLLGGPQAGIIAGKRELIAGLKRHPLARALRMDKASIAALNATLLHYAKGEAEREVPVWRMISTPLAEIEARASGWARAVGELGGSPMTRPSTSSGDPSTGSGRTGEKSVRPELVEGRREPTTAVSVIEGRSMIGGGSLPEESLPTRLLAIEHPDVEGLAKRLRLGEQAVVGRIEHGRLLLDPRTVHPNEDEALMNALREGLES